MEELILHLFNNKLPFKFDGEDIVVGSSDTGFYGVVDTAVSYNNYKDGKFTVNFGTKGFPSMKQFDTITETIKFIEEIM